MSNTVEVSKAKLLMICIKYLPILMAGMYFITSLLSILDIYCEVLSYFFSCSFISLLIIYIACDTLQFCKYYKAYLFYIFINNLINMYDYFIDFGGDNRIRWILVLGTFFILISYLLYKHLKEL